MFDQAKKRLSRAYQSFKTNVWTPYLAPAVMPVLRFLDKHKVSIALFIGSLILFSGMALMPPSITIGVPFLLFAISFYLEGKVKKAMAQKEKRDAKAEELLDLQIIELKQKTNPALTNAFGRTLEATTPKESQTEKPTLRKSKSLSAL